MATPLPENYEDLSTDKGFQFRFYCERCTDGFTSRFVPLRRPSLVEAAGDGARRSIGVTAPEDDEEVRAGALKKAVAEMERHLRLCRKCSQWVCIHSCWNSEEKLCKECAPKEDEEVGAAPDEIADEDQPAGAPHPAGGKRESGPRLVECIHCRAMVEDRSFCSECGESLRGANVCPECDADMAAGAKFCSICGAKL